jgi:hypothetical protein
MNIVMFGGFVLAAAVVAVGIGKWWGGVLDAYEDRSKDAG